MAKKRVKFNNVGQLAHQHKSKILSVVSEIIDSGYFLNGQQNTLLKKNLEKRFPGYAVTLCSSGHDALALALAALHLKPSDEVIFPANAYPTSFPVALSGAKPVLVDVDLNGQMDPASLKKTITSRTKAVIIVHLYGHTGQINKIKSILKYKKIVLIEDCAQSFGSKYKGKLTGTLGDIGCFSFYPTKNLGALGDAGAVITKNKTWSGFFSKAVMYGEKNRYHSEFVSFHSRVPEIQAGILNLYLKNFNEESAKRKKLYATFKKQFEKTIPAKYATIYTSSTAFSDPVPHLLLISAVKRDQLKMYLEKKGIDALIHYPVPVHLVSAYKYLGYKKGDFPTIEKLVQQKLSLPFHSSLQLKEIAYMIKTISEFYENSSQS